MDKDFSLPYDRDMDIDLDDMIDRAGGVTALARRLGLHRQAIYQWQAGGIPPLRQSWLKDHHPDLTAQAAQGGAGRTKRARQGVRAGRA